MDALDLNEVLATNENVDREVIRQAEQLERQLASIGVDVRPRYSLTPPLGNIESLFAYTAERQDTSIE